MAEDTIWVKSALPQARDGGSPVALWEADDAHPANAEGQHEVFIAGEKPVEVAETAGVMGALRDGRLVKVDQSGKAEKAEPAPPAPTAPAAPARPAGTR